MADASLGKAVLHTQLDTTGLKTGLAQAQAETQKFSQDAITSFKGIGAAIGAIAASQGLRAYVGFMRSAAVEAQQAATATTLFEKAVRRNNESASEGASMVQRLSDRFGVVNSIIEDSATTMLRQGATLEMVEKTLLTAGASAAAAGVDITTAFQNVSTAVVSGNSILLRSSGIIAGLGEAEREYAKTVGKTVEQLTDQERMQARVNAIYHETRYEIEDLDQILKGLPRAQAEVTKQWSTFRQTAGDLALKVVTPLTEGLGTMLRFVNDLPEPVKQGAIAMAGAATAGIALATGITAIKTALTGLNALGLLSFGPTGWIVLGVAAATGLAVALASAGGGSLTSAIDKTRDAIASGNADSMTSALDELTTQVNGPVKDALQGMRDELKKTGDVGVEQAQRMLTEVAKAQLDARRSFLGLSLFGPSALGDALATGGALLGQLDLKDQVRTALDDNDLLKAIDLLQDAIVAMTEANMDPRRSQPLIEFLNQIGSIPNFKFTPAPTTTTPTPTTPSTGTPDAKRTWQMVLDDLDKAGKEAMRRAAFEGTDEAFREAARKRVTLIDDAITEALTTFYGQVSPQELGALAARRARAEHEARIPVAAGTPPDPAGLAALKAQADAIMADTLQANRDARLQELRETLAHNSSLRQQALAIMADTRQAQADARAAEEAQRAYVDSLNDSEAELGRWLATADRLTASIKAANDETARMGLFADALAKYGSGRAGLAGTSAADRTGGRFPDRDVAAGMLRDTVVATVDAFREGKVGVAEVQAAVDAWTSVMPQSVQAINDLTEGILLLDRAAQDAARTAMQNELAPLVAPPGGWPIVKDFTDKFERSLRDGWKAPGDASNGVQRSNVITWQDAQRTLQAQEDAAAAAAKAQQDAADRFSSTVISAGFSFGDAAIKAFQDGDIVGVIRAGLSGAGSIFSGLDAKDSNILGTISLFGGTLGIGSLIAGGLGLIGTLIGALTGGGRNREDLERVRASGAATRGAPSIDLSVIINQSLSVQSLTDPAGKTAVNNLLLDTVRRLEDTIKRNIIPRVTALEGGAA